MDYTWDSDLLKQAKEGLYNQKKFFSGITPTESLFDVTGGFLSPMRSKIAKDFEYLDYFEFYENYLDKIIDKYRKIRYVQNSYQAKLSKDDILSLTYDFYKWLDPSIFHEFNKRFAERTTHIKFYNTKDANCALGQTFFYPSNHEIFISIYNSNDLSSVLTAIHEFAHAIWFDKVTENNLRAPGRSTYRELESIFMEMLAVDYFSKFPELKKDAKVERASMANSFIMELEALYAKFCIFNEYFIIKEKQNKPIYYYDFLSQAAADLGISVKDIKSIFNKPANQIMPYSLGSLVGFELYHIFQKDPERALWLYKIILSKNLKTEEEMDEEIKKIGVYPSSHIDTFTRKLNRY